MRQNPTLNFEQSLWNQGLTHVAGIDEVGRGCLAGPIVVGAVIFEPGTKMIAGVRDSKMLSTEQRVSLAEQIKEQALHYTIGVGSVELINDQGIVPALKCAINLALTQLKSCQRLLIDGRPLTSSEYQWPETEYIIKGDKKSYSIAAASILAKVYRDHLMKQLAEEFPEYGWDRNVGYGTKEHRQALRKIGKCEHHRELFLRKIL
ncbi:MAG TPA: ribonuclease HII [Patescibacteria group bacterium]